MFTKIVRLLLIISVILSIWLGYYGMFLFFPVLLLIVLKRVKISKIDIGLFGGFIFLMVFGPFFHFTFGDMSNGRLAFV